VHTYALRDPVPGRQDDPTLLTVTRTELARLRHGFLARYTVLAPVVAAVPLFLGSIGSSEAADGRLWEVFRNVTLEFWGVLVPITAAIYAALSVRADADAWRLMLSYGVPRWRFVVGKFAALSGLLALCTTLLFALLCTGALLTGRLGGDWPTLFAAAYLPWLTGLACTALALVVAIIWGLGPTIAVGVAGMLCGALVADKGFWWAVPVAWPMRVILPLVGIGPNGVPLPPDSPLHDTGVIAPAVALALSLTGVLLAAGALHLRRRDI
jgi:ABC-2 type transport system permease protein